MKGYMVTTEREDAPRRILSDRDVHFELSILKRHVWMRDEVPIPVQLEKYTQTSRQLHAEKRKRLRGRDITVGQRPSLCSLCEYT